MIVNIAMRDDNDHCPGVSPLGLCQGILNTIEEGAGSHCLLWSEDPILGVYQYTHVRLGVTIVIDDRTHDEAMDQYPDRPTIFMAPLP
jgi:hypothetical protein